MTLSTFSPGSELPTPRLKRSGRRASEGRSAGVFLPPRRPESLHGYAIELLPALPLGPAPFFRDKNVSSGLLKDDDGVFMFETHDPDGLRVAFKESGA